MERTGLLLLASAFVLSTGLACSAPRAPSPRSAVDAYAAALREGRTEDAYALLSADTKREISFAEFEKLLREHPREVDALVTSLGRPASAAHVTADVTTKDGRVLHLVYEEGAWRVDESAFDPYGQSEPKQALGSFVRAFDEKRYDVLLRFVPTADREGLDADVLRAAWEGEQKDEMAKIVDGVRRALPTARLELLGERATMSYGSSRVVELLREDGVWKIEDFQ